MWNLQPVADYIEIFYADLLQCRLYKMKNKKNYVDASMIGYRVMIAHLKLLIRLIGCWLMSVNICELEVCSNFKKF